MISKWGFKNKQGGFDQECKMIKEKTNRGREGLGDFFPSLININIAQTASHTKKHFFLLILH